MKNAITILIADDNNLMRDTLRFLISRVDQFKLIGEASSGVEVLEMAERLVPDIILIDINMAPVNGFEATKNIVGRNPLVKIIGLSIHRQPSYAKNIIELGAKGYITKSSPHKEIIHAITEVYNGREYICDELSGLVK